MARRATALLLAVTAVVCVLCGGAHAQQWATGVATFTGKQDATSVPGGACGYGALGADLRMSVAGVPLKTSPLAKQPLKGCGTCLEVKCADIACTSVAPFTVMVHDDCDECEPNQVNLQAAAFARMAPASEGRVAVQYREVPCKFRGNVVVGIDGFRRSGGGWVRMMFRNVNGPALAKAELVAGDTVLLMTNSFGAAWEASKLPVLPWSIRLTNVAGATLVLKDAVKKGETGDVVATANF